MTPRSLVPCVLSLGLAWGAPVCAADVMADPMRPPDGYRGEIETADKSVRPLVLQSTRISAGRRSALVSGRVVEPGDRIGDAVVARITETEVVLLQNGVEEVLTLYPAVDKRAPGGAGRPGREPHLPMPRGGQR